MVGSFVDSSFDCWNGVYIICRFVNLGCLVEIIYCVLTGIVETISWFAKRNDF